MGIGMTSIVTSSHQVVVGGLCLTDWETEVRLSVSSRIHDILCIYIQIRALDLDYVPWENTSVVSMVLQTHPLEGLPGGFSWQMSGLLPDLPWHPWYFL